LISSSSGVDNVIELNLVTSAGEHLTVNSHKHPDLFWALRGGGGGTYGIVTSATYRTHPNVTLTGIFFSASSYNNATFRKLCTEFIRIHPDLSDAGFSGYAQTSLHELDMLYIAPNVSQAQANQTIDPFFAFAQTLTPGGLNITMAFTTPFSSFYSWHKQLYSSDEQVGVTIEVASRLIPRDSIEGNYQGVADAILNLNVTCWAYVSNKAIKTYSVLIILLLTGS
jgi:hypothetical protein